MMTTNKLTKTFASGSLALGIAAVSSVAGSLLVAPSASAACFSGAATSFSSVTCGDKIFTYVSASEDFPTGNLEIDYDPVGDNYDFAYNFDPDYSGASSFVKYTVQITDPNYVFDQIKLDSETSGTTEQVTKLVEWDGGSQLLTSTAGGTDFFTVPDHVQFITVTDTFNPNNGTIQSASNSFTQKVPEPGTILGLLTVGGLGLVSRFKKQK